jgi:hypothetical protein
MKKHKCWYTVWIITPSSSFPQKSYDSLKTASIPPYIFDAVVSGEGVMCITPTHSLPCCIYSPARWTVLSTFICMSEYCITLHCIIYVCVGVCVQCTYRDAWIRNSHLPLVCSIQDGISISTAPVSLSVWVSALWLAVCVGRWEQVYTKEPSQLCSTYVASFTHTVHVTSYVCEQWMERNASCFSQHLMCLQ